MRRLLLILALFLPTPLIAQYTTAVTATITDTNGQAWSNGTWSATLVPQQGQSLPERDPTGAPVTSFYSGSMDGTGTLTVTLGNNSLLTPVGSRWQFQLCPQANAGCVQSFQTVFGSTINLSSQLSAVALSPTVNPTPISWAYNDAELKVIPGFGQLYYNTISSCYRFFNGSSWVSLCSGGGGGSSYSPVAQVPGGTINGTNTTFTLTGTPATGSLIFQWNGQVLQPNVGYTLSGSTVTTTIAPPSGSSLYASYWVSGSSTASPVAEVPTGTINGSNVTFTLANTPAAGTLLLQYNGQVLQPGVGYTITGATITMTTAPATGDHLYANYWH